MVNVLASKIAQPGDGDLNIDVEGLTLAAWTQVDRTFVVRLEGGSGWWWSPGAPDVASDLTVETTELSFTMNSPTDEQVRYYADKFAEWSDGRPLRLCGATGRCSTLIAASDDWLPLPHRNYPS